MTAQPHTTQKWLGTKHLSNTTAQSKTREGIMQWMRLNLDAPHSPSRARNNNIDPGEVALSPAANNKPNDRRW